MFDARINGSAGNKNPFFRKFEVLEGGGFLNQFGFGFLVKDGVVKVGTVDVSQILRANVRISDDLENGMTLLNKDVTGFVMEGDDGLGGVFEIVDEGLFDGVGEREFVAGAGVDEVFDIFE